jgi:hypothetical protein
MIDFERQEYERFITAAQTCQSEPLTDEEFEGFRKGWQASLSTHEPEWRAAIAAFCEAEGLTIENRLDDKHYQRLIGPWRSDDPLAASDAEIA